MTFIMTFAGVLVFYLLLVMGSGSGDLGSIGDFPTGSIGVFYSYEEIMAGIVLALISALVARLVLGKADSTKMFNPLRWLMFIFYVCTVWLFYLAKANIDVAYRVITGRINPGIVRISPGLKNDLSRTILANSITLTPGTLTVDVDDRTGDFFIHWINVSETKDMDEKIAGVCGPFPKWARRLAE